MPADHYEVLQVSAAAGPDVIKAAHRTLIRAYHPAAVSCDEALREKHSEISKRINEARDVLLDPARRAELDTRHSVSSVTAEDGAPDCRTTGPSPSVPGRETPIGGPPSCNPTPEPPRSSIAYRLARGLVVFLVAWRVAYLVAFLAALAFSAVMGQADVFLGGASSP